MIRILKTLLLWLLIASLPVRGLAAVDTSCVSAHQGATVSSMSSHMQGEAPDQLDSCGMGQNLVSMADHSAHDQHSHKDLNNGSCAACYIGAAAPPLAVLAAPAPAGSEAVMHFPAIPFTGFIPAGLERPPRHILA